MAEPVNNNGVFRADNGSDVTISGGSIGSGFTANPGSTVSITGGAFGSHFLVSNSSTVDIRGGSFGSNFNAYHRVTLFGGDFRIDGELIDGLEEDGNTVSRLLILPGSLLSGILQDGTPFAFSGVGADRDGFHNRGLYLTSTTLPDAGIKVVSVDDGPGPRGVRNGQSLFLEAGGVLRENFNASRGSTVTINAGNVGDNFEVFGGDVLIAGGSVGDGADAYYGSHVVVTGGSVGKEFDAENGSFVSIRGGSIGDGFNAYRGSNVIIKGGTGGITFDANDGSHVQISGGSIGDFFDARFGSEVLISGGIIGSNFTALSGSTVTISGGSFGEEFHADGRSTVNLEGSQFILDGNDITHLLLENIPYLISERDVVLSGTLADGSPFSFDLNNSRSSIAEGDYFSRFAQVSVMLVASNVPEPGSFLLLVVACLRFTGTRAR